MVLSGSKFNCFLPVMGTLEHPYRKAAATEKESAIFFMGLSNFCYKQCKRKKYLAFVLFVKTKELIELDATSVPISS